MYGKESGTWVGGIGTAAGVLAVFETVSRRAVDVAPFVVGGNGTMHAARVSVGTRGSVEDADVLHSGATNTNSSGAQSTLEVTA